MDASSRMGRFLSRTTGSRLRERSGKSLRELVNAALREGLPRLFQGREEHHRFVVRSLEVGRCLLPAVDDVAETLAAAEGEDFR